MSALPPKADMCGGISSCLLCTKSGLYAPQQKDGYSITSSASNCIELDTASPIALAAFILITSSNFVGCMIGRSAGFSPLRILPTYTPVRRYASARPNWLALGPTRPIAIARLKLQSAEVREVGTQCRLSPFWTVVDLALIGLLFVANATLPESGHSY